MIAERVLRNDLVVDGNGATARQADVAIRGGRIVAIGRVEPNPRAYGTSPRKIHYILDEKVMTLGRAIRSCSSLPAAIPSLSDREVLRPGAAADLVAFGPDVSRDTATYDNPTR